MATDSLIGTGPKDATSRGRRPHKEAPHGPVPPPTWERRRTTTTSYQSPTPHRHALTRLASYRNRYRTQKKGSPVAVSAWCKPSRGRAGGEDEWKPETVEFPQTGTVQPVRPHTPLLHKGGGHLPKKPRWRPLPSIPLRDWSSCPAP